MTNRNWETMTDMDFEALLQDSLQDVPPSQIVAEVTPWKKSMNQVLVGMVLTSITFNFLLLNYILPSIGTVLQLLGFRSLRNDNKWFKTCFIIAVVRTIYLLPSIILGTTILPSILDTAQLTSIITLANMAMIFLQLICLWRAILAVQNKAGIAPHAGGAVFMLIWYIIVCLLAFIQFISLIVMGSMIVIYILIIRSMSKLSKELDEAGYAIEVAPVRIGNRELVIALIAILLIGSILGYTFGNSYPMEWHKLNYSKDIEAENIKSQLIDLGFPEYVLNDLSPEDIKACENAIRVAVDVTDEPVNEGEVVEVRPNHHQTVYKVKELKITGIAVQVPAERETWIIFHHFLWTTDPGFYGTESIHLWTACRPMNEGWLSAGELTGRVLHDKDGETFVADYYSIGPETYTSNSMFWGEQTSTDMFATFSMPHSSDNQRGYVTYPIVSNIDGYIIDSWINYTHQRSMFQYPVMTAMEKRMTNSWNDAGAFITIQDALQFHMNDDEIVMHGQ